MLAGTSKVISSADCWQPLLDELALQKSFIDQFSVAWVNDYRSGGGHIYCGRGCRACCSLTVNCTLTEAVALAVTLDETQVAAIAAYVGRLKEELPVCTDLKGYLRMQRTVLGWCPLLDVDGACSAYGQRPLSCRALHSTKESHWCGVDFAGLSSAEKEDYVDSLDRSVAAFPLHYVASIQETGSDLEGRGLSLLQQTFGFSLYGNMPVLVHLVRHHGLAEAAVMSRSATEMCVVSAGLNHPFLLTYSP